MINPLAIATRGRLSNSIKKTLTYATLGWLVIAGNVTPPTKPPLVGGSGNSVTHTKRYQDVEKNILLERIAREDEEVLTIINIFLKCQ